MNIIKKIYCRLFQLCFRIILPILPYRNPIILNEMDRIIGVLNDKNIRKILIATDKGIVRAGIVSLLTKVLEQGDIEYYIYDNTVANPTISNVEEARKMYLDNKLEGIIAIGGGSAIDLAKIVAARIAKPNKEVRDMKGLLKINKKLPLLIAIPTTSGTGSEVTLAAVITDDKTHHKYPINDFCLIPHYAVLDYKNTLGLPKNITSTTGMDALTHAIEAYIGRSTTKETRKMSLEAVRLIVENIEECYNNPLNEEARKKMLYASHYAGIAFSKSYVGYVHAIAHTLGGKYNVPHGLANAVILPIMLEIYGDSIYKKLKELAVYSKISNIDDNEHDAALKFINWIYEINKKMSIPLNIDLINNDDLDELVSHALNEANPLYPVPVLMDKKELKEVYLKLKNNKFY